MKKLSVGALGDEIDEISQEVVNKRYKFGKQERNSMKLRGLIQEFHLQLTAYSERENRENRGKKITKEIIQEIP